MRARLADSLDYLSDQVGSVLNLDRADSSATIEQIRSHPQSPQRFGAYYDLVLALEHGQIDHGRRLARELIGEPADALKTRVAAINDRPSAHAERYRRLFLPEPEMAAAPGAALLADCQDRVDRAFALLDAGFPELAGEIRALLREIVVAAGPEDPKALTFDGASCYMLWGAILLNARGQTTVLDTAQALAHESGHNLLFGYCASGPLTDNAEDELFSSPLRADPRPMDGVVHATYVIARMHQALDRLLCSGVLDEAQTKAAQTDLAIHRRNFDAGDQVIREGGRLTELGSGLMASARAYMAS